MKNFLPFIFLFAISQLHAQYYYNDIIGTQETNRQMKTFLANKVKTVSAKGIDQMGRAATDFSEFQEVKENGRALKISNFSNRNKTVYYNRFDEQGRIMSITDSSSDIQSVTTYQYDNEGRVSIVKNASRDSAADFEQTEIHTWLYGSDGKPVKMWRVINNTDSLEIRFTPDEQGNTGDEKTYKRGYETGALYYYYDDKKRLTDIVRFNTRAKKLLPDVMFEYDENDRVIQRITTTSSLNLGYLIWRYLYDEKGLKTKEALFNNNKELTGKIEYTYTFFQ
jgi:antitoxin component YwqK of YwqJK toxin-antitoxin module